MPFGPKDKTKQHSTQWKSAINAEKLNQILGIYTSRAEILVNPKTT